MYYDPVELLVGVVEFTVIIDHLREYVAQEKLAERLSCEGAKKMSLRTCCIQIPVTSAP